MAAELVISSWNERQKLSKKWKNHHLSRSCCSNKINSLSLVNLWVIFKFTSRWTKLLERECSKHIEKCMECGGARCLWLRMWSRVTSSNLADCYVKTAALNKKWAMISSLCCFQQKHFWLFFKLKKQRLHLTKLLWSLEALQFIKLGMDERSVFSVWKVTSFL